MHWIGLLFGAQVCAHLNWPFRMQAKNSRIFRHVQFFDTRAPFEAGCDRLLMESCSKRPDGILCSADRRRNVLVYWKRDIDSTVLCNTGSSSSLAIFHALSFRAVNRCALDSAVLPIIYPRVITSCRQRIATKLLSPALPSVRRIFANPEAAAGWSAHAPAHTGSDKRLHAVLDWRSKRASIICRTSLNWESNNLLNQLLPALQSVPRNGVLTPADHDACCRRLFANSKFRRLNRNRRQTNKNTAAVQWTT